ncbi:MAG: NAD(P)/FAD-dependent oxidoreductase, partial [Candidatus Eremiobacteraeota bacterium]|nr:NAD(P)/FAD-dependent oxidoreductase [Candidatus Eremiobacteraeota bacterium]
MNVDLVVIGTGSAGHTAALKCRRRGWTVAIADEREFGGTCTLRGCDPKKVLVAAARISDDVVRFTARGVFDRVPSLQWSQLMRFKRTFTDPIPDERRRAYDEAGIVSLHGKARFVGETELRVGDDRVRSRFVLIATGAKPAHVADGDAMLLTSEGFLDLETLPESLVFVGGGYIAFEFAHIAARAGAVVTLLHKDSRPLNGFDGEMVDALVDISREIGIRIALDTTVKAVVADARGVRVDAVGGDGKRKTFTAAAGVLAAGRGPDIDDLDLDAGHVERTKRGIKVDAYLRSVSNPRVYAAGDAADGGGLPLTPVAGYEGDVVADNLLDDNAREVDFSGLVTMVYTIPSLGSVGMSEATARQRGIACDVRSGDMTQWYSTRHVAGRKARYKVVLEKATGTILGAAILGPHAEEQLNVLALAVRRGLPGRDVGDVLFGYPTG